MRLLYAWLVEERMTLRQILKRLNFGPWFPRCGRHPWSPSTVHHILPDPVYTGTAYANRYEFVAAKKPRPRKPTYSGVGCRRLRPKDQWIPIAVPALIDQDTWDRAQAQLARNATLSFRNNSKHDYLLRCLLTCGACGLSMHGMTRPAGKRAERPTTAAPARIAWKPPGRSRVPAPTSPRRTSSGPCGSMSVVCWKTRSGWWPSSIGSPAMPSIPPPTSSRPNSGS